MALSTNLKGFTLIEVLISLVIFSIILTITSIFLTSSIDTLGISQSKSQKIKDIGTASILFRRDVRQSANLPIRNFEFFDQTFNTMYSQVNSNKLSFVSLNKSSDGYTTNYIEYEFIDNNLVRRQFFVANPADINQQQSIELLKNVSQGEFEFYTSNRWFNYWPVNQRTNQRPPRLIRIKFNINKEPYQFVVNPTINYSYVEE
jgi:type II secretion system protein J